MRPVVDYIIRLSKRHINGESNIRDEVFHHRLYPLYVFIKQSTAKYFVLSFINSSLTVR